MSIKRTWTGKLAVDGQNFIYTVQFKENVQKPQKIADSWKCANFDGFLMTSLHGEFASFEYQHRILRRNLNFIL